MHVQVDVLTECLKIYVCARTRTCMYVRVAGVFCYIDRAWSTTSPSPAQLCPISPHSMLYRAPAPHAHPTFPLRLVLVFHSTSPIRKPSTLRRLNLQSHVFSCVLVSAPTMIYELSQICIRVTYSIYVHTGIVFPCASIVPYSDNFEFFVSFLRNRAINELYFTLYFGEKKEK